MTNEVRVTDPKTGGEKGSKGTRFDLLPIEIERRLPGGDAATFAVYQLRQNLLLWLEDRSDVRYLIDAIMAAAAAYAIINPGGTPWERALADHYAVGATKYADRNWERGYAWSLSYEALRRHLASWDEGDWIDDETGSDHMICVIWHLVALATFVIRGIGTDDLG